MDPVTGELAKFFLMGFFEYLKGQGLSAEEADRLYQAEKAEAFAKDPGDLKDV